MRPQKTKRPCSGDGPDGLIREDITEDTCLVSGVMPHACDVFFALTACPFFFQESFYPTKLLCT